MSCGKMQEYLDGLLTQDALGALDADLADHVRICPRCRDEYAGAMKTFNLLQPSIEEISTTNLKERIMSNIQAMDTESPRRRTAWFGKRALVAAMAAVVVAVAMYNFRPPQAAYALAQIVEATRTLHSMHMRIEPERDGSVQEIWAQFAEDGQITRLRMNFSHTEDGAKDVVWEGDKADIWFRDKGAVTTIKDEGSLAAFRNQYELFDPAVAIERLQRDKDEGVADVEITKTSDPDGFIVVTVQKSDEPNEHDVYKVDPNTDLVMRHECYKNQDGQTALDYVEDYDYNDIEDQAFVIDAPADVMRADQSEGVAGVEQGNRSKEEVAKEVVKQFFEALIAKDYAKASPVYSSVPPEHIKEIVKAINFVRIVSIGQPEPHEPTGSLRVPCEIEVETNGIKTIMKPNGPFVREVPNRPGIWTIIGGF